MPSTVVEIKLTTRTYLGAIVALSECWRLLRQQGRQRRAVARCFVRALRAGDIRVDPTFYAPPTPRVYVTSTKP